MYLRTVLVCGSCFAFSCLIAPLHCCQKGQALHGKRVAVLCADGVRNYMSKVLAFLDDV